jgi:hypothetical protein
MAFYAAPTSAGRELLVGASPLKSERIASDHTGMIHSFSILVPVLIV